MKDYSQTALLQGTVSDVDSQNMRFGLVLRTGELVTVQVEPQSWYSVLSNLDGINRDCLADLQPPVESEDDSHRQFRKYIRKGDRLFVRGILAEDATGKRFVARQIDLLHFRPGEFLFEDTHWWLTQIAYMADEWLEDVFGDKRSYQMDDFARLYRTNLNIHGQPTDDKVQVTATLSRFIYGMSSTSLQLQVFQEN